MSKRSSKSPKTPTKKVPTKVETKTEARPETPATPQAPETAWSDEVMQWAIASSTCGGLPQKDESEDEKDEKPAPACP